MKTCIKCGSHAFNLYAEEIDQGGFCDVHYWQGRAHRAEAQPEQEPLAWTVVGDGKFGEIEIGQHAETDLDACRYWVSRGYSLVPLYTTPPKRPWGKPWVSLTDDEASWCQAPSTIQTWKRIEAKLKEKNT